MKTRTLFFMLAFAVMLPVSSNAQVGNILKSRINKAINKKVDEKIDTAVNKRIEETQQSRDNQQTESEPQGKPGRLGAGILGGKTDIKHNDEYDFTGRIYMQMEAYDKNKVTKSDYFTYYNANTLNACIELRISDPEGSGATVPTLFLFDNDNRCFMMLMEGTDAKTGIISSIPDDSTLTAQAGTQKVKEVNNATITKTGNTKMIAGFRCDEYKIVDPDVEGYSNAWLTKDVKVKADKKNWGKAGMPTYYNYPGFEDAMMLALESYDKNNKLEMKMETKEINDNFKHSVSTVGYVLIKMNFGQAGAKKKR
jgi:hypothetical protein